MASLARILAAVICCSLNAVIAADDFPIKNVVLYKHGIGYFERSGVVPPNGQARLEFKDSDMNDILKSLTVVDASGARISGVHYDTNENLGQRLSDFRFQIEAGETLSVFLDRLRGAHVDLKTADAVPAGRIVSARQLVMGKDLATTTSQEQLTLLLDSGDLVNLDLSQVRSVHFTDTQLEQQLKSYLAASAQSNVSGKRSLFIDASSGSRDWKIAYIAPAAIWKSSYRLTLESKESMLEGWAIVDNTTGDDWNNVHLSVVSGRPISFVSPLDQALMGNRQVAALPDDAAAAPQVYGGSYEASASLHANERLEDRESLSSAASGSGNGTGRGGVVGGGTGEGVYSLVAPKAVPRTIAKAPSEIQEAVAAASGASLGELFEYQFANAVTVKNNQSAMLPFLQAKIAARKLLIYTDQDGEHPVNAAEITNTAGKTLDGGPVTVYDSGAYAGEALVETFKSGDKRLIGYGVDYGSRITSHFDSNVNRIVGMHSSGGVMEVRRAWRDSRTYTIRNVDDKAKTLLIQQMAEPRYKILSPTPVERTSDAYRFEVHLAPNSSETLKVERERLVSEMVAIQDANIDSLFEQVSGADLNATARHQFEAISALKHQLSEAEAALAANKVNAEALTQDETRLRQNIDSLNRVQGQQTEVHQYISRLNDDEVRLSAFRDKRDDLARQVSDLRSQVNAAVAKLSF